MTKLPEVHWTRVSAAACLLVASRLLGRLPGYRVYGWHGQGDSQNEWLRIGRPGDPAAPMIAIGRSGTIGVTMPGGAVEDVIGASGDDSTDPYRRWSSGEESIQSVAALILAALPGAAREVRSIDDERHVAQIQLVAEVARQSALFGLDLRVQSNRTVSDVQIDDSELRELAQHQSGLPGAVWTFTDPGDVQIIVVAGLRAWRLGKGIVDLTAQVGELAREPSTVAATLLERISASPHRPGLGLSAAVEAFNRKERFFLFGSLSGALCSGEIHGPGLVLSDQAIGALNSVEGADWNVPGHAWVGVDYQLSWLHGALSWHAGEIAPGQDRDWPHRIVDDVEVVTGNQEDADALVVWRADGKDWLLLLEAKGYGAWSNAQMASKVSRFNATFGRYQDVEARLLLVSPDRPSKLITADWPAQSQVDGIPLWMPLATSGLRTMTQRVGSDGLPSAAGEYFRLPRPFRGQPGIL